MAENKGNAPLTVANIKEMTSAQIADRIEEVRQVMQQEKQIQDELNGGK